MRSRLRSAFGRSGLLGVAVALVLSWIIAEGSGIAHYETGIHQTGTGIVNSGGSPAAGFWSRLERLLSGGIRFKGPAIGTTAEPEVLATGNCYDSGAGVSCSGFRNLQEYLAVVRASQNLDIPFGQLRARIQDGQSLTEAIQALRPSVNAKKEAYRAETEAQRLLRDSS